MKSLKFFVLIFSLFFAVSGCQTVKDKTDKIIQKENQRLEKFIGKSSNFLKVELGEPDEDYKNTKGNLEFIYKTKKYGIPCERKFEMNSNSIVIGFVSNGCF